MPAQEDLESVILSVPREIVPGERRVALTPELVPKLKNAGLDVVVQSGAGDQAGFANSGYVNRGARLELEVLDSAEVILKVQPPTAIEVERMKEGSILIGFLRPYDNAEGIKTLAVRRVTAFSMELMPRIARAQPMDALSAMSTVAGYKAVLLAAARLPKFFPLLMTAAGTVTPARVFIVGAGVAGLQAIGTAKRLGAVVEAYDTRPAVKEQVESLGAKFAELALDAKDAEDKSGYASGTCDSLCSHETHKGTERSHYLFLCAKQNNYLPPYGFSWNEVGRKVNPSGSSSKQRWRTRRRQHCAEREDVKGGQKCRLRKSRSEAMLIVRRLS
jgi:NAD/NADP transhydrogenase alpha subunit